MPSSFFELSVATTGLFTSKAAMNVTANNIANAETAGYSRQVALIRARTPLNYQNGRGMVGTGSEIYGIGQVRNTYLDAKYWNHKGVLGEYSAKASQTRILQTVLNETDDTGIKVSVDNFFKSIREDWSVDSGDLTARLSTIGASETLANYFNTTYSSLQKQQGEVNQEIKGMVSTINNLGRQIQNLNKQIFTSELSGQQANDLRDARALVVDELSKYVNVEVKEVELNKDLLTGECEKRYLVSVNGYDFVSHFDMNELACVERTVKNNFEDSDGLYDIYWNNGVKFNSEYSLNSLGGELKGLLVTRDGNNINSPTAQLTNATALPDGRMSVTLENWSRADMPESGNITINGETYAYGNYKYDERTGTMTMEIPPADGRMTVGSSVYNFSQLKIAPTGDITLKIVPMPTDSELRQRIKIGDMVIDGAVTKNPDGTITIHSTSASSNVANLAFTPSGTGVKVGQSVDYKGLPYFMSRLNTFVRGLARSVNLGQDVHGNQLESVIGHYNAYNRLEDGDNTGYNYFAYDGCPNSRDEYLDYHLMTAGNFSVARELQNNPLALAASVSPSADESDNTYIIDHLLSLNHNPRIFNEGEYGNFIESIIGELGVITNQAITFENNYTDITAAVDYQRLSVSSVSLDEEMATMIYLQQIYNACAKMVSTLNGIYDTTINMV